jgi:hypothetical protein
MSVTKTHPPATVPSAASPARMDGRRVHLRAVGKCSFRYWSTPASPSMARRLTLSFIVTSHTSINVATVDDTRAYVRDYLLPMITAFND